MKRISTLSLLILLSLIVVACGEDATSTPVPPTAAPTEPPAEPTAAPTKEPAVAEPPAEPVPPPLGEGVASTLRLPDLEGRVVVAVTGNDYTPLNFVDPLSGKAVGWEYDAVNEICRRLNCAVDWQVTSWDTMIAAVHEGQFDVGMDGITITDERKEQVDFSAPYMVSQQFMLVRADEERFATPGDFAADENLLVGSQAGTTNFYVAVYEILDGDEANPRIKLFENFGAAVQALITGDVDLVLMDAASSRG
ncbi:MAG: transporter substrate-binding domain-containing protein, partial [Anaerolineae bacterium]